MVDLLRQRGQLQEAKETLGDAPTVRDRHVPLHTVTWHVGEGDVGRRADGAQVTRMYWVVGDGR